MTKGVFDPATIAQAIVEAAAGIAARQPESGTNLTISNILRSAGDYLKVADEFLAEGQITTAMYALAASDSACRLVDMLVSGDPEAAALAAPFAAPFAPRGEVAA